VFSSKNFSEIRAWSKIEKESRIFFRFMTDLMRSLKGKFRILGRKKPDSW
jgi:hypothetical protein